MRQLRAAALGAALLMLVSMQALAFDAVLYMGMGDWLFAAHLQRIGDELRRCGANVVIRPWWSPAAGRFDAAVGQSAGTSTLDQTDARIKVALDPTIRFWPRKPVTVSYYTDGIGIHLPHSKNIYVPRAGHVALPSVVADDVVRLVTLGRCGRVVKG